VRVVPDKSLTHRGVLLGAITPGRTFLRDPNTGQDCRSTLEAAAALGARVREDADGWVIEGGALREAENVLDLGNSGTGMRLLAGLLAGYPFLSVLTGDASLRRRPMGRILRPLAEMGAAVEARAGERAPIVLRGGRLHGIDYDSPVSSAQVKSAVLLAGLSLTEGQVRVREPILSRDHTERLLRWCGAPLQNDHEGWTRLDAGARLHPTEWSVPGDVSAATFFLVGAIITPGSRVEIPHVGLNPTRAGALDVLRRMGARLKVQVEPGDGPEPVGTLGAESGPLRGVEVGGNEIPRLIDEIPVLAVAAACAEGETRFADVAELRVKESDRIRTTCAMLRSFGVETEEGEDSFVVHGRGRLDGGVVATAGDHRIAMAAMIAAGAAAGEVRIDSEEMIATSDPGFVGRLRLLRGEER
jgi:3-phosphoshikimate 1-carboxyvinyltransferase